MAKAKRKLERRDDALSRERIVAAAIELLDEKGEQGLTFRALATRLATGSGAIYWHVENKSQLLVAATDAVVALALAEVVASSAAPDAIRGIAVGVFEAIDEHPWVGTQLSSNPLEAATLDIFERLGAQVHALGARGRARFTSASTLLSYVLGVSIQNAANARVLRPRATRSEFLAAEAARWKALDPLAFPFTRSVASQLRSHDDRAEFLAGIDLVLAGIEASNRAS